MRYLLDTNILSHIARYPEAPPALKAIKLGFEQLSTSVIVACEIQFGLHKNPHLRSARQVRELLANMEIVAFEQPAEETYGRLRAALAGAGRIIGANDLFIAAHALSLGYVLVTDNMREFARIEGLQIENWLR